MPFLNRASLKNERKAFNQKKAYNFVDKISSKAKFKEGIGVGFFFDTLSLLLNDIGQNLQI